MKLHVSDLFKKFEKEKGNIVTLEGWVRTNRSQKEFGFISLNDGTTFDTLQIVYDKDLDNFDSISKFRVGSAIRVIGT